MGVEGEREGVGEKCWKEEGKEGAGEEKGWVTLWLSFGRKR